MQKFPFDESIKLDLMYVDPAVIKIYTKCQYNRMLNITVFNISELIKSQTFRLDLHEIYGIFY